VAARNFLRAAAAGQDFRLEVTGPRNRLAKLDACNAIRTMVDSKSARSTSGRRSTSHIILANLSPGPRASDNGDAAVGRLLHRAAVLSCGAARAPGSDRFSSTSMSASFTFPAMCRRLLSEARKVRSRLAF